MPIHEILLAFLYASVACLAITLIYNMRGKFIFLAPLGGSICWIAYNLLNFTGNDILQNFAATMAVALYSEILARIYKAPVTMFLIVGILPLVPGAGIYYTMEYCVSGNQIAFGQSLVHTLAVAGALALGIVLISSLFRFCMLFWYHRKKKKQCKKA